MLDSNTKRTINNLRNILVGKVPDPKSQVDQITLALIYKSMYDMDEKSKNLKGKPQFFKEEMKKYSWERIISNSISGEDRVKLYEEALDKFSKEEEFPTFFRDVFKYSTLPYKDPETLRLFVNEINDFNYNNNNNGSDNSEGLGNAFEHLLSYLGSQGDAGQFRTPRHIIDFIVEVVRPKKDEKIFDPACGTAGFLISAFKSIIRENSKNYKEKDYIHSFIREDRSDSESNISQPNGHFDGRNLKSHYKSLYNNIIGYDISPDMVKLSKVNLFLNKFKEPKVEVQDPLSNDGVWGEKNKCDVILANPPFMTPKGGIQPHSQFPIPSNRSEVLFVEYIIEHLNHKKGRAGIIVPEGVIFKSDNAYKKLRKMLLEEGGLWAVVSLPSGVFRPYSGVKTSILFLDKKRSKNSEEILFVDVKNDGFDLGTNRRRIDRNDLPQAFEDLKNYSDEKFKESSISFLVNKNEISRDQSCNLNLNQYRPQKEVTSDYPMVKLGDICEIKRGTMITKKQTEKGDIPVIAGGKNPAYYHNKHNRESPVITVSASGAYAGFVNFFNEKIFASDCSTIKSSSKKVSIEFIYRILKHKQNEIYTLQKGGGQPHVYAKDIFNVIIPLPHLSVQKEIVAEVEGYQSIIDGANQIINNWKPTFKIDPKWQIVKLGDVCEIKRGGSPRPIQDYIVDGEEEGVNWIKIGDVAEGEKYITQTKEKIKQSGVKNTRLVKKGDLILSNSMSFGRPYIVKINGAIHDGWLLIRVKTNEIYVDFLYYALLHQHTEEQFRNLATGGVVKNLNSSLVKGVSIPLPHLSVQKEIVEKIQEEEKIVESNKKLIEINQEKINKKISDLFK